MLRFPKHRHAHTQTQEGQAEKCLESRCIKPTLPEWLSIFELERLEFSNQTWLMFRCCNHGVNMLEICFDA